MPRLLPSLLRYAHSIDPLLPILLPACRDLHSSRNELRWLREHAKIAAGATTTTNTTKLLQWQHRFRKLVVERATGRPIQYILGNQPFGDLEVLCEPGVLIPRFVCPYPSSFLPNEPLTPLQQAGNGKPHYAPCRAPLIIHISSRRERATIAPHS